MNLVIDTAHANCSVGLFLGKDCISFQDKAIMQGHASVLPQMVAEVAPDLSKVQNIIVDVGPGSFTGIRVGVAYAKGLGKGLNVPLWGVTAFQGFASLLPENQEGLVIIDAKRKDLYCQWISASGEKGDPLNLTPQDIATQFDLRILNCVGNGVAQLEQALEIKVTTISYEKQVLALLNDVFLKEKAFQPANPFYLRSADVTQG